MSDHIAHIGICDDTFRLASVHPQVHDHFKELMAAQRESSHMGSVTRWADHFSADVIAWAAGHKDDPNADAKLAFVLGSLTHRSADRHTKPITRCWPGHDDGGRAGGTANESKIMQDIFVYREVFGGGRGEHAGLFAHPLLRVAESDDEQAMEKLLRIMWQRALIAMHTLKPDREHIHDWLDAFFDHLQAYPKSLNQYAELNAEWDPAKVKKYLVDKNFYSRRDPMIVLARDIQHGSTVTGEQVVEAMARTDKTHSRYARCLKRAIEYLLAAGDLYDGRIDLDAAKTAFDVGVPELALQE